MSRPSSARPQVREAALPCHNATARSQVACAELGDRRLFAALAGFSITHALGLVAMLLLILPGISPHVPLDERAAYVREHTTAWRLGWLAWQASALSDAWLTFELLRRARAIGAGNAQRWMIAAVVLLVLALLPDQYAEARMIGDFTRAANLEAWHEELRLYMRLTGTWACLAYTAMTVCWLQAARRLPGSRRIGIWAQMSMAVAFVGAAIANYFAWHSAGESAAAFDAATAFNGFAFLALLANVALALERAAMPRAPA
jgi:hypothetical protein